MPPRSQESLSAILSCLLLVTVSTAALSNDQPWRAYGSRGELSLGVFVTDFDTKFRLDGQTGSGTSLEYELIPGASVGVGYDVVGLNLETDTSALMANLDWNYQGVLVYLKGKF